MMKKLPLSRTLGYGLLVWGIPFVTAVGIFPLHAGDRALFESIMAVAVALATAVSFIGFSRGAGRLTAGTGVLIGVLWLAICAGIDLLMFMQGPMKMSLANYIKDIGVTYLMIPVLTSAMASLERY